MKKVKRSWDLLSEGQRKKAIEDIIDYFNTEKDEQMGIIAAEELLDRVLQSVSIDLYNKGVESGIAVINKRFRSFLIEVEAESKK